MKKILLLIVFTLLFIPSINALEITDNSIKYENGTIKVSGKSEEDDVQVAVFDGNDMIIYGVASVENNNYNYVSSKIELDNNKEYTIKVASVDGKTVKTSTLTLSETKSTPSEETPNTLDNIVVYLSLGIISLVGIAASVVYFKKKIN